jgi:hypothetical protein
LQICARLPRHRQFSRWESCQSGKCVSDIGIAARRCATVRWRDVIVAIALRAE